MIKSTFYNLPDAKRERVIRAIMAEFAGNDSDKVSINRIIERADISRGSFYQYFDDKVDLAEVVLRSLVDLSLEELFRASAALGLVADWHGPFSCYIASGWDEWARDKLRRGVSR